MDPDEARRFEQLAEGEVLAGHIAATFRTTPEGNWQVVLTHLELGLDP